jgi:hypothetical protein
VLGEIGLATLLVALDALYKLVFWRRCGTVMHRCLEAVMPARLAAQNNHTLNASTDWKADWKSALFPQELVTFVTTATASAAELLGQISTTTALHNFTLRYGGGDDGGYGTRDWRCCQRCGQQRNDYAVRDPSTNTPTKPHGRGGNASFAT